tara:strand:+ start:2752 stop:3015 length:264 start_codon:yes stop_codon:yes gene_type:complete
MIYFLLYKILDIFFQSAYLILMIRVLLSWIPHDRYHPIVNVIYKCSDPILSPFQNIVPSWKIGIDLSPIFAFIALGIAKEFLFKILF